MDREIFARSRYKLDRTQASFADLLGISTKAVQSYEQGLRKIPFHIERKIYFLLSQSRKIAPGTKRNCWDLLSCKDKKECPAWEFNAGKFCWFFCRTNCNNFEKDNFKQAISNCRDCDVIKRLLD